MITCSIRESKPHVLLRHPPQGPAGPAWGRLACRWMTGEAHRSDSSREAWMCLGRGESLAFFPICRGCGADTGWRPREAPKWLSGFGWMRCGAASAPWPWRTACVAAPWRRRTFPPLEHEGEIQPSRDGNAAWTSYTDARRTAVSSHRKPGMEPLRASMLMQRRARMHSTQPGSLQTRGTRLELELAPRHPPDIPAQESRGLECRQR